MDSKTSTKQRGLRMAMQVAALSVGAGAAAMALAASEAKADDSTSVTTDAQGPTAGPEPIRVTGWSCWGPTSRGPLAPPAQSTDDFEALLAEIPS